MSNEEVKDIYDFTVIPLWVRIVISSTAGMLVIFSFIKLACDLYSRSFTVSEGAYFLDIFFYSIVILILVNFP